MSSTLSDNRRIAKNTLFLYVRSIIVLIITLYTSRVILQVLGVEDYGIYNLIGGVVTMFSMISATLATASQRFITFALGRKDRDNLKKVFSTSISLHIIMGFIAVIVLEVLGVYLINNQLQIPAGRTSAAIWVLHFSVLTLFFNISAVPFNALIVAHEKLDIYAYVSLVDAALKLGVVFLVASATFDKLIFYAFLLSLVTILVTLFYVSYSRKAFSEAKSFNLHIESKIFKEMFAFSGWNLLGNGSFVLRNQGVDMILNVFFGVTVNAAKGISNQVQHAVTVFVNNFITALNPQLTKAIAAQDIERRDFLIKEGAMCSFYLYSMFIVPLLIVVPQVLSLWLVEVPKYTVGFVRWLLIYSLLDSLSRLLINAILANGNIRNYEIVMGTTKLLAMPLVYIVLAFIYENPLVGIWVNLGLEAVCLILRLFYVKKLLDFDSRMYLKDVVIKCIVTFLIAFGLSFLFAKVVTDRLFIFVPVSVVVCGLIIFYLGFGSKEREWVTSLVVNKLKKKNE